MGAATSQHEPEGCDDRGDYKRQDEWSAKEASQYLIAARLVRLPEEKGLLHFLEDAFAGTPLPLPWVMVRDSDGKVRFIDEATGEISSRHPLESSLADLLSISRKLLVLSPTLREQAVAALLEAYEKQAQAEYTKWYPVMQESGEVYYCHSETKQTVWEHPVGVLLPAYYMKIKAIGWLSDRDYVAEITGSSSGMSRSLTGSEVHIPTFAPDGMSSLRNDKATTERSRRPSQPSLMQVRQVPRHQQDKIHMQRCGVSGRISVQQRRQSESRSMEAFFIGEGVASDSSDVELGGGDPGVLVEPHGVDKLARWYEA